MPLPFTNPPNSLCVLRLSAVGDVCHTLPVVRTIQSAWPQTHITWIIGKTEAGLVGDIPGIEFVIFDKSLGWRAYRSVRRQLKGRRFDALLHMQMSLRSSLINRLVNTDIRLGFDRARAKDLQWLVNNQQIPAHSRQHVMDSLFGFTEALGITARNLRWDIPVSQQDKDSINALIPQDKPILVISPCSSMSYRNWNAQGYAQVADYATQHYAFRVVLSGGTSSQENEMGKNIEKFMTTRPVNLIGKTSLKQLLYVLHNADIIVSPDSGPAHMATAVRTPVIGLYACTNPERARPYFSADYVVNQYPQAVLGKFGKPPEELPWGTRVRESGTMDRITAEDVMVKLDLLVGELRETSGRSGK
ncbi:MAG: glycosyltransferase family 9 protein [Gammaproteobacteria bacterium]|nr:glycosyltransferase family 9 protein [Gammaproteobacteria bacterium]